MTRTHKTVSEEQTSYKNSKVLEELEKENKIDLSEWMTMKELIFLLCSGFHSPEEKERHDKYLVCEMAKKVDKSPGAMTKKEKEKIGERDNRLSLLLQYTNENICSGATPLEKVHLLMKDQFSTTHLGPKKRATEKAKSKSVDRSTGALFGEDIGFLKKVFDRVSKKKKGDGENEQSEEDKNGAIQEVLEEVGIGLLMRALRCILNR
jgi:hypothetical protein